MRSINPILILFVILVLVSCKKSDTVTPMEFDIIVVAGQSNTLLGAGFDQTLDAPDESIFQLGRNLDNNQIKLASEPMDHYTKVDSCIGFALTFAKLYKEKYLQSGRKILIIPCGYGGTSLSNNDWNANDPLFRDVIERVKYSLTKYPGSTLNAILWHQGENDIQNPTYQEQLDNMITEMRAQSNHPNVPFILGGMVPYWTNINDTLYNIQDIISTTKDRLPNCGYADPTQPFVIEKVDNNDNPIHYNAEGLRELGKRYFEEFENLN